MLGIYIQVKHGQLPILNRDSIGFFALVILFLSYSFAYLYGAFAKQLPWLSTLKRSNIILAWVLIAFAILFNINFIINLLPKVH